MNTPLLGTGILLFASLASAQGHRADRVEIPTIDPYSFPVVNLRLAASGVRANPARNYLWVRVDEAAQGGQDLNGDGDALDDVILLHDFRTGETLNLGVAGFYGGFLENRLWVHVDEEEQGGVDLNGDGDVDDNVLHLYDLRERRMRNMRTGSRGNFTPPVESGGFLVTSGKEFPFDLTGDGDTEDFVVLFLAPGASQLSHLPLAIRYHRVLTDVPVVVLAVDEVAQGNTDLNGDGDADDRILYAHDLRLGLSERIGEIPPSGFFQPPLTDGGLTGAVYYYASEDGALDLNGDGDRVDSVFQIYNHAHRALLNTAVASSYGEYFEVSGNLALLQTTEGGNGGIDLNGDGDVSPQERVSFVYDSTTHSMVPLGLATDGGIVRFPDCRLVHGKHFLRVHERRQGESDLNADGDANDQVLHVYDPETTTTTNLGLDLTTANCFPSNGRKVGLSVSEPGQGRTDLNGDGDSRDNGILHLYDLDTGRTTNLRLAFEDVVFGAEHALVRVKETPQGRTDLNGDGDIEDRVVHVVDLRTGRAVNLGFAGHDMRFLGPHRGTFAVHERDQGRDLNTDGDTWDTLVFVYDTRTGELFYFKRTISTPGVGMRAFCCERALVFSLREDEVGRDLNGDGDAQDAVLHYLPWSD